MSRDTSFYYSFLVLPPRKRRAIVAVWDFCRAVDDAVDEVVPEMEWKDGLSPEARAHAARQLAGWRDEVRRCFDQDVPVTPQGRALQPFVREFGLPREAFTDLLDGVEMDLQYTTYSTFDALAEYCRRVASAVGLICVEIFGYRDPRSREYAIELGMALQLTNIIRDVAVDLQRGRVYLPAEDLQHFGCTEADLRAGRVTAAVRDLLAFECRRAREYYRRAAETLPRADASRLVAAEIMGGIYYDILTRVQKCGFDVFSRRIRVPRPQRALIAARVWARTMLKP